MSGFSPNYQRGFKLTFENGWTVSVVWGPGAYGSNYGEEFEGYRDKAWEADTKVEKMTAPQRELITKLAQEKNIYLRPGFEGLSKAQASQVITEIQAGTYDSQEGVPF